ncbi:MAG: VWA domain-containing protein [Flavobacteriaceae bacterium]|nr:VWA domain-containing protein [Flavobacteriaceae bacterium]
MKTLKLITLSIAILSVITCKGNEKQEISKLTTPETVVSNNNQFIKVALLLDTSNSMDGLIDQAKAQLWEIVNELSYAKCKGKQPNLQIALYEYGNDGLSSYEDYIRKIIGFTSDLDDVSKELFSLTTNGGSEYCGAVIQSSLEKLDWGNNLDDLKMIFIAGNEPFTQGKINYRDATTNAKEKGVIVNTIFCGDYNQGVSSSWKEGAQLANGDYMSINHNLQTVHIATPYDDVIIQLNIKLNKTYVYYGESGKRKKEVQQEQDSNASGYSKANAVSRTITKGSHLYRNSTWDLVDAEEEVEDFSFDTLKEEELPDNLKGKSSKEIKIYVEAKRKERVEIQNEIASLNKKRKNYIVNSNQENSNTLESAMINAIKKQAKKKNYTWD